MKHLLALFLLFSVIYSCKKESAVKKLPYANSPILGKWYLSQDSIYDEDNGKRTGANSIYNFPVKNMAFYVEFNSDGSAAIDYGYDYPQNGVFTLQQNNFTINTSPAVKGSFAPISKYGFIQQLTPTNLVINFPGYVPTSADTIKLTEVARFTR